VLFRSELNKTSDVVEGIFGPVILRVTEIKAEKTTPFNDVKDRIRKDLAIVKATEELFDMHDRLEDERAAGDPLVEAARKIGLETRVIKMIDRAGLAPDGKRVENVPAGGKLLEEAFQIAQGVEADPISLSGDGFVWFEVAGVTSERQKPQDEVLDAVKKGWIDQKTAELVDEVAQKIAKRVTDGEEFTKVAGELLPADSLGQIGKTTKSAELDRRGSENGLTNAAVILGFETAKDKMAISSDNAAETILVITRNIIAPQTTTPDKTLKKRFSSNVSDDLLNQLVAKLQQNDDVRINRQAIEAALTY